MTFYVTGLLSTSAMFRNLKVYDFKKLSVATNSTEQCNITPYFNFYCVCWESERTTNAEGKMGVNSELWSWNTAISV